MVLSEMKTALKSHKTLLCSHGSASKSCENATSTGAIWKRFLNGARWKRNPLRCRVNTKSSTFSSRSSAQPPSLLRNLPYLKTITLTVFRVIFFSLLYLKSLRFKGTLANLSTNFDGFVWTRENSAVIFSCRHRVNAVSLTLNTNKDGLKDFSKVASCYWLHVYWPTLREIDLFSPCLFHRVHPLP